MIIGAASTPKPTAADVLRSERRLVGLKILLTVFSYVDAYIVENNRPLPLHVSERNALQTLIPWLMLECRYVGTRPCRALPEESRFMASPYDKLNGRWCTAEPRVRADELLGEIEADIARAIRAERCTKAPGKILLDGGG
jgi:hypothetical protein